MLAVLPTVRNDGIEEVDLILLRARGGRLLGLLLLPAILLLLFFLLTFGVLLLPFLIVAITLLLLLVLFILLAFGVLLPFLILFIALLLLVLLILLFLYFFLLAFLALLGFGLLDLLGQRRRVLESSGAGDRLVHLLRLVRAGARLLGGFNWWRLGGHGRRLAGTV
jgi:hypothetical protein